MTPSLDIVTVVGARPQFVKAATVSRAIAKTGGRVRERIVHTGQHFDDNMSDVFFRELDIPPPWRSLGVAGGGHGAMTGRMLEAVEAALLEERPDAVLVYGDTNSTIAGALAAAKLHIPVVHVEAGLRSFNRRMPEEINRVLTDHLSALLFCPTAASVANLKAEGIAKGVRRVGDVSHDATLHAIEKSRATSDATERLGLTGEAFAVCTLHRAENTDEPARFRRVLDAVAREAGGRPIVFPVHPRTRAVLEREGLSLPGAVLTEPLGYFDMHRLLADCELVLTDSGGLQKEAYFHRKPCVTLRDETEWVETIEAGWNRLWTSPTWTSPRRDIPDYGDGDAAGAIVRAIEDRFSARPDLTGRAPAEIAELARAAMAEDRLSAGAAAVGALVAADPGGAETVALVSNWLDHVTRGGHAEERREALGWLARLVEPPAYAADWYAQLNLTLYSDLKGANRDEQALDVARRAFGRLRDHAARPLDGPALEIAAALAKDLFEREAYAEAEQVLSFAFATTVSPPG